MALKAIRLQTLDCHSNSRARFRWSSPVLLYPPFEDISKSTLAKNTIRPEVPQESLASSGAHISLLLALRYRVSVAAVSQSS
nr:hypothetical protein Iba_chr02aCG17340 [Ipomoea batatas]